MIVSYRSDIEKIREYCKTQDARTLESVSTEALDFFLKEAGGATDDLVNKVQREKEKRVFACLGGEAVRKIERDFADKLSVVSWNVNGLRSRIVDDKTAQRKPGKGKDFICRSVVRDSPLGFLINSPIVKADILCLQETKLDENMNKIFSKPVESCGWVTYWANADCSNYSGVSTWVREKFASGATSSTGFPQEILDGLGEKAQRRMQEHRTYRGGLKRSLRAGECYPLLDGGRLLTVKLPALKLIIVNTYAPNTGRAGAVSLERIVEYEALKQNGQDPDHAVKYYAGRGYEGQEVMIDRRVDWDQAMGMYLKSLISSSEEYEVIWCGDMNVLPDLDDLYRGRFTEELLAKTQLKAGEGGLDDVQLAEFLQEISDLEDVIEGVKREEIIGGHSGFRKEERDGFKKILKETGLVDVWRQRNPVGAAPDDPTDAYGFTYWDQKEPITRVLNRGLRLDYFCTTSAVAFSSYVEIFPQVGYGATPYASDHAPVVLNFEDKRKM